MRIAIKDELELAYKNLSINISSRSYPTQAHLPKTYYNLSAAKRLPRPGPSDLVQ
jgi:hypothetical protein